MDPLVLHIPEPPPGQGYAEYEDFKALALLAANGIAPDEAALVGALAASSPVLRGAAAHALGSLGMASGVEALKHLEAEADDLVKVEAAYALVRLGADEYRKSLLAALADPVNAYLGPPVAAGDLARLGDPVGFGVIEACLAEENLIARVGGCKQLFFFVPLQGQAAADGQPVDALGLLERTVDDPDPEIRRIAQLQWDELHAS